MSGSEDGDAEAIAELSQEWYETGQAPPEQGDLLLNFPLAAITYEDGDVGLGRYSQNVIIVTQSCDFQKSSQTEVLLASVFGFDEIQAASEAFRSTRYRDALQQGSVHSEFALPPVPSGSGKFQVVSFRKLHVLPKDYLLDNMGQDVLRLRSPYKEYFAQAYARFMMRVGLPLPLPVIQ